MKKMLLLAVAAAFSTLSFAQSNLIGTKSVPAKMSHNFRPVGVDAPAAKLTAVGDTVFQYHINGAAGTDTLSFYSYVNDTGSLYGMNAFGDKGWAERYDINGAASTYKVIGVFTIFGGTVQAGSTKTVDFHCWDEGPKTAINATRNHSGFPNTSLATVNKPFTSLGVGAMGDDPLDEETYHAFTTPTGFLADTFFVGYTTNYTWAGAGGDTIGLYTNLIGERSETVASAVPGDTTFNNVVVFQRSTGAWADAVYSKAATNNMYIFPVMVVGAGTSVGVESAITHKGFTFYNASPNPASNSTTVKFALASKADVTIKMMDMTGKTLSTIQNDGVAAGTHTIPVNTSALASGNYICLIRTSEGDGIATQITITK